MPDLDLHQARSVPLYVQGEDGDFVIPDDSVTNLNGTPKPPLEVGESFTAEVNGREVTLAQILTPGMFYERFIDIEESRRFQQS